VKEAKAKAFFEKLERQMQDEEKREQEEEEKRIEEEKKERKKKIEAEFFAKEAAGQKDSKTSKASSSYTTNAKTTVLDELDDCDDDTSEKPGTKTSSFFDTDDSKSEVSECSTVFQGAWLWTSLKDERLDRLVSEFRYDFKKVVDKLRSEFSAARLTEKNARERYGLLLRKGKSSEGRNKLLMTIAEDSTLKEEMGHEKEEENNSTKSSEEKNADSNLLPWQQPRKLPEVDMSNVESAADLIDQLASSFDEEKDDGTTNNYIAMMGKPKTKQDVENMKWWTRKLKNIGKQGGNENNMSSTNAFEEAMYSTGSSILGGRNNLDETGSTSFVKKNPLPWEREKQEMDEKKALSAVAEKIQTFCSPGRKSHF